MKCALMAPDPPAARPGRRDASSSRCTCRNALTSEAPYLLLGIHLHDDRRNRDLDGGDRDLVLVGEVFQLLEIWSVRVFRYIGNDVIAATPMTFAESCVRSQSVMKAGGPAAMKSTEPDRALHSSPTARQLDPPDRQVRDARFLSLPLDELVFLHHHQRQESDSAGAPGNAHLPGAEPRLQPFITPLASAPAPSKRNLRRFNLMRALSPSRCRRHHRACRYAKSVQSAFPFAGR